MQKSVQITSIIVTGVLLTVLIAIIGINSIINPSKTINSYGEAQITTMPDLVAVYFNIKTSGSDMSEVQSENNKITNDLKLNLIALGFEESDIQTQNFFVGPRYIYKNGERTQEGYEATHSIRVEFSSDEFSKIGSVIDAGVDAGAAINYINFELSQEKQNDMKADAIQLAAEDARIKAQALAEGVGSELGNLVSVSNSNFGYSPWVVYSAREDSTNEDAKFATTNINPSEQEIYASVTAVFKLK